MYDHVSKSLSRVYWQYRNSPKLIEWLKTLPEISQSSIEEQAEKIQHIIDIDTAKGDQLDICGRIAGFLQRPYVSVPPHCEQSKADDALFRVLIKAKIIKNTSYATIDEIKESLDYILSVDSTVLDGQDMGMRIVLSNDEVSSIYLKALIDHSLMPKPQGVNLKDTIVIKHTPFGFGLHYENFNYSTFWDGGKLNNFNAKIIISIISDGTVSGQINASVGVAIADAEIVIVTEDTEGLITRYRTVTDISGSFTYKIDSGGTKLLVHAKAQLLTQTCEVLSVTSKKVIFSG